MLWTKQDEKLAFFQGYGLFELDSGVYQIQKLDESDTFKTDSDAFYHVESEYGKGCITAQKALALNGQPCPRGIYV